VNARGGEIVLIAGLGDGREVEVKLRPLHRNKPCAALSRARRVVFVEDL
jgi:hypothetical protein